MRFLWIGLVGLGACVARPASYGSLPDELRTATVVSTLEPGAVIPASATFSWMPGSFVRLGPRFDAAEVEAEILRILGEAMQRRGLYLVPGNRGELWVGYAIADESGVDGADLDQLYGLDGHRGENLNHPRGALVVDLLDRATKRPLWRGSVSILTQPDLPVELRRQRIEQGIEGLLDRLKPGY
jgi:hypothetical protein